MRFPSSLPCPLDFRYSFPAKDRRKRRSFRAGTVDAPNLENPFPSQFTPWNKGKLVGQKAPLRLSDIWSIRVRLQLAGRARDLALFNLAIDSKLRGCDLVSLRLRDVSHGSAIARRATVLQRKTGRPVQFELTELTRSAIAEWSRQAQLRPASYLFFGQGDGHLSTRQYARIVASWVTAVGLDRHSYGTHSMRRTKNLRAV